MKVIFERIENMTAWQRVLVFAMTLFLINGWTWAVVVLHQRNGMYPTNADSIGLPIGITFIASFITLPVLASIAFLPSTKFMAQLCSRGSAWRAFMTIILLTLYFVAMVLALGGTGYWLEPDHYSIALCYLFLVCVLALFLVVDMKWLFSNW